MSFCGGGHTAANSRETVLFQPLLPFIILLCMRIAGCEQKKMGEGGIR